MLTLIRLSAEFFFVGAFSVGGGMATIPFLTSMAQRTGWLSLHELGTIIAISESTPGPIGVNMATYVGYTVSGIPGAILATLFLTLPAFLVIFLLAKVIRRLRHQPSFEAVFYGLRPASVGLIAAVLLSFSLTTFFTLHGSMIVHWKPVLLFLAISLFMLLPKIKKLPVPAFLLLAAIAGVCFRM